MATRKGAAVVQTAPRQQKRKTPPPTAKGLPRGVWACIWGLAGIFCLLSLLPVDGFLLKATQSGLRALIGAGAYTFPFALLALSVLLFRRRRGPVRLRGVCILLLPLLLGSIVHAFLCSGAYDLSLETFFDLLETGIDGKSGGLLSGTLYIFLEWGLSGLGALVLLLALTIGATLIALHLTPAMLLEMLFSPGFYEDDDDDYDDEGSLEQRQAVSSPAPKPETPPPKRRVNLDIPIGDSPAPTHTDKAEIPRRKRKRPISPDEYLRQSKGESISEEADAPPPPADTSPHPPAPVPLVPDIMDLVQNREEAEPELSALSAENISTSAERPAPPASFEETPAPPQAERAEVLDVYEQAELNEEMDENQKSPMPVYDYPPPNLLTLGKRVSNAGAEAELRENSECLIDTLQSFGIGAKIIGIVRGPSVTRFELTIPRGVKIARIVSLSEDIALSMGAISVRIAPIPDKSAVGIEAPNKAVNTVFIRECITSSVFASAKSPLSFALGKDITGKPVVCDIAKMPHLLIAGTTGSGKSVCINSMLVSLLYKSRPEEVRLIMIDPKMVELGNYNGIPHLLIPVVTDPRKAAGALNWAVGEMERRYQAFMQNQVRDLEGYNALMRTKRAAAEAEEGADPDLYQVLPRIVIVIDELADLMMVAAKEVETSICRIAQKARAAGMHLVVATQRPSADVITGIMKANIPSRIAFAVASQIESRIILDTSGAEKLIGRGDMLYAPLGEAKPLRVQGCFISSDEIEAVIAYIKKTSVAEYNEEILEHIERQVEEDGDVLDSGDEDERFEEAVDILLECQQASTSMLQTRLRLGYARARRIMEQMQARGIVGPPEGSKPRQIKISYEEWQEMKARRHDTLS